MWGFPAFFSLHISKIPFSSMQTFLAATSVKTFRESENRMAPKNIVKNSKNDQMPTDEVQSFNTRSGVQRREILKKKPDGNELEILRRQNVKKNVPATFNAPETIDLTDAAQKVLLRFRIIITFFHKQNFQEQMMRERFKNLDENWDKLVILIYLKYFRLDLLRNFLVLRWKRAS